MSAETEYRKHVISTLTSRGVWVERIEKARGMADGRPDLDILFGATIIPTELKVGKIKGGFLNVTNVRPSQFSWHRKFKRAGGRSTFYVGVPTETGWDTYDMSIEMFSTYGQKIPLEELSVLNL